VRAPRHSVKYDQRTMAPPIIVIFGAAVRPDGHPSATLRERIDAAARFGATQPNPIFIPTGGQGRFGDSEAAVMRDRLLDHGVTAERIILEDTATDTLSSVRAVRHLLLAQGLKGTVHVATSGYHQPRCVALLWLAGVPARRVPPPPAPPGRWYWRLREVPALPYDIVLVIGLRLLRRL
jgi:uncharacterized SAM-binding protein YcdF (DUF218 family)